MLHSDKEFTDHGTNHTINDRMGGSVGSRYNTVKQYKKSEFKWKKYLKDFRKHNKIIYSITKNSVLRSELKKIKKIRKQASKKGCDFSSDSSSDNLDSDSSLAISISLYTYRRPSERKEMNKLDHVVTNHLKTTKYQLNESINNYPMFDTNSLNLYRGTSNLLPVVTVSLQC